MFDGCLCTLSEPDRVFDVVSVDCLFSLPVPFSCAVVEDYAVVRGAVLLFWTVSAVEPVFCSGAMYRWRPPLAVDKDHVVTFSIPVVWVTLEAVYIEVGSTIHAVSFRLKNDIVLFAVFV